jgi:protein-S-isoprenylcysteine O-methyltransferase Ste14
VLLGESVFFGSTSLLRYAAIVAVIFHVFVLIQEEPTLRRKMGPTYEQYCKDVWRWIPRIPHRPRTDAL